MGVLQAAGDRCGVLRSVVIGALVAAGLAYALVAHGVASRRFRRWTWDAVSYLSVARNVAAGKGIKADFAYFHAGPRDRLPYPLTVQPPGYPMAVAALIVAGTAPQSAALHVSLVAHLLTVALFALLGWWRGGAYGCLLATWLCASCWVLARVSAMGMSETLFCFLTVASLLAAQGALRSVTAGCARRGLFVVFGLASGLSVGVRYVGIVTFPLFLVLCAALFLRRRGRGERRSLCVAVCLSAVAFGVVVAPVVLRNLSVAGTLHGYVYAASSNPFTRNLALAMRAASVDLLPLAFFRLVFYPWGGWPHGQALPAIGLLVALGGTAVWGCARNRNPADLLPALWSLAYLLLLCWVRSRIRVQPIGTRLLVPFYCVVLYGFAERSAQILARRSSARRLLAALLVFHAVFLTGQLESFGRVVRVVGRTRPEPWPCAGAAAWLSTHTEPGDVVITHKDAQAWLWWRLPSRRFLGVVWEEGGVLKQVHEGDLRRLRTMFGARYVVLPKPAAVHRALRDELMTYAPEVTHGLVCDEEAMKRASAAVGPVPATLRDSGAYIERVYVNRGSPELEFLAELDDALVFRIVGG